MQTMGNDRMLRAESDFPNHTEGMLEGGNGTTRKKCSSGITDAIADRDLPPVDTLIRLESVHRTFVALTGTVVVAIRLVNRIGRGLCMRLFIAWAAPGPYRETHHQPEPDQNTSQTHHNPRRPCLVRVHITGRRAKIN